MAHDVFVSYSSEDKSVADAIVAHLEQRGVRCWFAPRDITAGTLWGEAIVTAIEDSRLMVIVLSDRSNRSQQVLREVERAVSNEVIIVPFRIESVDPTGAMAYYLATEHWLDALTPPLETHIERLEQTVRKLIIDESIVVTAEPVPGRLRAWLRRPLFIAALALVVAVLAAVVGVVIVSRGDGPRDAHLDLVGRFQTSRSPAALAVVDGTVYVAGGDVLTELDVRKPSAPELVVEHAVPGAEDVAVVDGVAYVMQGPPSGGEPQALAIVDTDDGRVLGSLSAEETAAGAAFDLAGVDADERLAYLTGWNYVGIVDVADPAKPRLLWEWQPPDNTGQACTIAVVGDIAYVGAGTVGLFIFDISDPQAAEQLGRLDTPSWVVDVAAHDGAVYLTLGDSGFATVDASDPARPVLGDLLKLPGFASVVAVSDGQAHVTYFAAEDVPEPRGGIPVGSGVATIDVADPAALVQLATYELDAPTDVQASGGLVYVGDEIQGVLVLEVEETG